jgi:hypothetical protein
MNSLSKTLIIKQLRTHYPISLALCNAILEDCNLDIACAELKIKAELTTQLIQKTGIEPALATELLEKHGFEVEKAGQVFKNWLLSVTASILARPKTEAEFKISLVFNALILSGKAGRNWNETERNVLKSSLIF